MSAELSSADLIGNLSAIADRLALARDELCRLDGLIGDGDHGLAMADGFGAAAKAARSLTPETATLADVFNAGAKALLNAVGASSGPLYATALMRAAKAAGARGAMPLDEAPKLIAAMAEGIRTRGLAAPGEKTMLDAWAPAARASEDCAAQGIALAETLQRIRVAAEQGAESTKSMVATKGRSSRLGERSLDHVDPGAVSATIIIETLTTDWLARARASGLSD
jgi:phosphoenolpyruvate---glycerone phosphotransferase subunit DhaL